MWYLIVLKVGDFSYSTTISPNTLPTVEPTVVLCEQKEISKLRLENLRLRAEIERSKLQTNFSALLDQEVGDRTWVKCAWDRITSIDRESILDHFDKNLLGPLELRSLLMRFVVKNTRCSFSGRFPSIRPTFNFFQLYGPINEGQDDEELVRDLFCEIDLNGDGVISFEELEVALIKLEKQEIERFLLTKSRCVRSGRFVPIRPSSKYSDECNSELLGAFKRLFQYHAQSSIGINYCSFLHAFEELPRVRGERVRWARSLKLENFLAGLLMKGNIVDGLKGLRELNAVEMEQHIFDVTARFSLLLPQLLKSALMRLKDNYGENALVFKNEKFAMEGSYIGTFAELRHFHEGPEKLIGTPNPNVEVGIKREHCERSNSLKVFVPPNYNFATCSRDEYEFVVDPRASFEYPHTPVDKRKWNPAVSTYWKGHRGRDVVPLEKVMEIQIAETGRSAKEILGKSEIICLRLYTGPCFILYNAVLRKIPADVFCSLDDNQYETSIFCIISGITKLSKVTAIPPNRKLFRGLGGMLLPDQFWKSNGSFRGGVEWGFMSTTTNRQVSIQYSGVDKQRGTVFEIVAGRIDIGADLAWLSQYPAEAEYLFPPLSCLEVIDEPYVEAGVIVVPLRVNMNTKGVTVEQLLERRKLLHISMVKNLRCLHSLYCMQFFLIYTFN